ncbi:MAG: trypsin-like peptidase domain-containing protein [Siculibacillus sp.]|nr:trypsin-like peptidase domain-containing protein [Siculibacillus sp.]
MNGRSNRFLLTAVLIVLVALLARPWIERWFFSAGTPRPIEARGDLSDFEKTSIRVFEGVAPSVVQVVALPAGERVRSEGGASSGTGFVWDRAGHVVTNDHVVGNTRTVAVRLASGEVVRAETVGRAPHSDLVVLRLHDTTRLPAPVPLGEARSLRVGQVAYAIGNPFGLDQSLTQGLISALKRRLPTSDGREIPDVIQTDAAINPGNSGGPLLDSAGRLIGVNTAIWSPSGANAGIGFAIPVDVVGRVVPELIRRGRVPTPGIGILVADEAVATRLGIDGVVVAAVVPGSPAERAGLVGIEDAAGTLADVVIAVEGRPVKRLADLTEALEEIGIGKAVRLTVQRAGSVRREVGVDVMDIGADAR